MGRAHGSIAKRQDGLQHRAVWKWISNLNTSIGYADDEESVPPAYRRISGYPIKAVAVKVVITTSISILCTIVATLIAYRISK